MIFLLRFYDSINSDESDFRMKSNPIAYFLGFLLFSSHLILSFKHFFVDKIIEDKTLFGILKNEPILIRAIINVN